MDTNRSEIARLELLADVDALAGRLNRWAENAPNWKPAENVQALIRRLTARAENLKVRLDAPLVVATLGGTGTGKSSLVNALLGQEVTAAGRSRPTTNRPVLICREDISPEMLGIDAADVEVHTHDLPTLANLVLIDCPDPDTSEDSGEDSGEESTVTNLQRLRGILPHCDVLLVTTTQQKYRSAKVSDELAATAPGARLVFVQTHADLDEDIRDDWRKVLSEHYSSGDIFLVDSPTALVNSPAAMVDAAEGRQPQGDFAALLKLLTSELSGAAGNRIRRANFLDLVADTLDGCRRRIDQQMPQVEQVEKVIEEHREKLARQLSGRTRDELLGSRRQWEQRLLAAVTSRWGFSPFSLLLRLFQGLGGLMSGAMVWRARTPAQMALWGAVGGVQTWQKYRKRQLASQGVERAANACWSPADLTESALILDGYASEAGLDRENTQTVAVREEANRATEAFAATAGGQLEAVIDKLARRHTGWCTRWRYEILLLAMLGVLLYRLGRNFFYDSWFVAQPVPVFGLDFYLSAGFWLLLWCLLLYWMFSGRLRRGLKREINELGENWCQSTSASGVFAALESDCRGVHQFRRDLSEIETQVSTLRRRLALPEERLGHVR